MPYNRCPKPFAVVKLLLGSSPVHLARRGSLPTLLAELFFSNPNQLQVIHRQVHFKFQIFVHRRNSGVWGRLPLPNERKNVGHSGDTCNNNELSVKTSPGRTKLEIFHHLAEMTKYALGEGF